MRFAELIRFALVVFLFCAPLAAQQFALVQQLNSSSAGSACGGATGVNCTSATLASTGTGHLLIFGIWMQTGTMGAITSNNGHNVSWVHPAGCLSNQTGVNTFMDFSYELSSIAGDTQFTAAVTSNQGRANTVWEVSYTGGPVYFDSCAVLSNVVAAVTQPSPVLTSHSNNAITFSIESSTTTSASAAPFNTNFTNNSGREYTWAFNLTGASAAASFNWTTNAASTFGNSSITFGARTRLRSQ